MIRHLYSGFDTLDIAFQGALPIETLKLLAEAKERAQTTRQPALVEIGPAGVALLVQSSGLRGGYAFRADRGPTGEIWLFKDDTDYREWNIFVSVRAAALACRGFEETCDQLMDLLAGMGARVVGHSVNRIDFASDFLAPEFELNLDQFVAHPKTKIRPRWEDHVHWTDRHRVGAVFQGRRVKTATVGKMPGRQIIVYDKRQVAIELRKFFWFAIWGLDRNDRSLDVWRVEARAGKRELTRYGLRTLDDIRASIGDVFRQALRGVRYVAPLQTDSNASPGRRFTPSGRPRKPGWSMPSPITARASCPPSSAPSSARPRSRCTRDWSWATPPGSRSQAASTTRI